MDGETNRSSTSGLKSGVRVMFQDNKPRRPSADIMYIYEYVLL